MAVYFIFITIIAVAISLFIAVLRLPIIIAKKRNLQKSDIDIITLLSWVSLLVGVTWIVALVMSLVYKQIEEKSLPTQSKINFDKLSQLFKLKEKGVLTQDEFEAAKEKLLQ